MNIADLRKKDLDKIKVELLWLIDKDDVWVPGTVVIRSDQLFWIPDEEHPNTWNCLIENCDPAEIRIVRHVKKTFEIGDRVWSLNYGWGSVALPPTDLDLEEYPIYVNFDSGSSEQYTSEGFLWSACVNPSLFHANQGVLEFDTDEPVVMADDQTIWVRDSETDAWVPRHFAVYVTTGGVYCYPDGKSKHSSSDNEPYDHWKFFRTSAPEFSG